MLAILCSGQGGQGETMFDLVAGAPEARDVFNAAGALLGEDPRLVAGRGGPAIHANRTAQILCCAKAMALWAVLGPKVDAKLVVAGYSVGEVAAWGVAGALAPTAVLEIAARRATLMDEAADGAAGLASIRGLAPATIDALCARHDVHVAIRNAADHVVIGGRRAALDAAMSAATEAGAARVTPIAVEVASHTPLMREAAERFGAELARRDDVGGPAARLISGIDGTSVFDVRRGLAKLGRQVSETVAWEACLGACVSAGATRALELGPGGALTRMMGGQIGEGAARGADEFRSVDGLVRWLRG